MIERRHLRSKDILEGSITPEGLDKFNLEFQGIKFVQYIQPKYKGSLKSWETATYFKTWFKTLKIDHIVVLLWSGKKGNITTVTQDYANQEVVGAIVKKKTAVATYSKETENNREWQQQAIKEILVLLGGSYTKKGKDGLLYALNEKSFQVTITNKAGDILFHKNELTEPIARKVLDANLDRLVKELNQ